MAVGVGSGVPVGGGVPSVGVSVGNTTAKATL
jgi:hypothetical protein